MSLDFNKLTIKEGSSIFDAIRIINSGASQICLVIDENKKLIGTITDGDIRRAILKGISLHEKVHKCMNKDFIFAHQNISEEEIFAILKQKEIKHLPILDNRGILIDIHLAEELYKVSKIANPVVIMAGGFGKRLGEITTNTPKPMLEIHGKPMLQIILEQCIDFGFFNFYLSVNYLKEQIIDFFGDVSKWGININYLIENEPLGTAGSLRLLPDSIEYPILIMNGDVLTKCNFKSMLKIHEDSNANATIAVREYKTKVPFGVISTDGLVVKSFDEKPTLTHLINAGIYIVDKAIIELISDNNFLDMPNLLENGINNNLIVNVSPLTDYWLDVGRPETLAQAKNEWKD